ncbi:MAG: hypothetical protein OHK0039_26270 [Bacteroidia bacterium]
MLLLLAGMAQRVQGQAISDESILPAMTPATIEDREKTAREQDLEAAGVSVLETGFVKAVEELPPGVMFFNVLRIQNNTTKTYTFTPGFHLPGNCKLILQEQDQGVIELRPGQAKYMPVRVSFPSDVEGGVPYALKVDLLDPQGQAIAPPVETRVSYQRISRWRMTTPFSKAYVSSSSAEAVEVAFTFYNEGNALETLALEATIGRLLDVEEARGDAFAVQFQVRPSTDTTLRLHVRLRKTQEAASGAAYRLTVKATSSLDTVPQDQEVIFQQIDTEFRNSLKEDQSPLILSLSQAGVSAAMGNTLVGLSGHLLLERQRELHYSYEFQHNFLGAAQRSVATDMWLGSRLQLTYSDRRNTLRLGDVGAGTGISIGGRGAGIYHEVSDKTQVSITAARNLRLPIWGISVGADHAFSERLRVSGGITYRKDSGKQLVAYAPSVQVGFSPAAGHTIGFKGVATREQTYGRGMRPVDNKGAGYELNYGGSFGELKLRLKNRYSSLGYLGGSPGVFAIEGEAAYLFRNQHALKLAYRNVSKRFERSDEDGTLLATARQRVRYLSLSYGFRAGGQPFNFTAYSGRVDASQHVLLQDKDDYLSTQSAGLSLATVFKSAQNSALSLIPSVKLDMNRLVNTSATEAVLHPSIFKATAGLRGQYKYGTVSAEYLYLPRLQLREHAFSAQAAYVQQMQLGASYDRTFLQEKLHISGSANIGYQLTDRELHTRTDARIAYESTGGWDFHAGIGADPAKLAQGAAFSEAANLSLGARKVVEGQQPRLKYYNLEILFFKDLNGDKTPTPNEPGIASVMVAIEREKTPAVPGQEEIRFRAGSIMSDEAGKAAYQKIPQGTYHLELDELFASMEYTNLNGNAFDVALNRHTRIVVPYARSVAIVGKVEITRDKFSRLVGITPANIRVTVTDANGDEYYTLTDDRGAYVITVPFSTAYTVQMKNVLGEKFELIGGEQQIAVGETDLRFEILFHFKEKGRSINFGS